LTLVECASNVLGCWLGFNELKAAGDIDRMPRALALAAIDRRARSGGIRPDDTVVVVLTGSGLKALDRIQSLLGEWNPDATTDARCRYCCEGSSRG
jgi:threonine synthase